MDEKKKKNPSTDSGTTSNEVLNRLGFASLYYWWSISQSAFFTVLLRLRSYENFNSMLAECKDDAELLHLLSQKEV